MANKIEELGKILIEIDALTERVKELETVKSGLKFAIAIEQRELQMAQVQNQQQASNPTGCENDDKDMQSV